MVNKLVALVTGGNKGLGLEIARQLGAKGIAVVVAARDEEKAANAASMLRGEGADVIPLKLDVTNGSDILRAAVFLQDRFGRLDILINNAGFTDVGKNDTSLELFRSVYETNVFGPFALTQALLPLLKASEAGRIVNQSSIMGSLSSISKGQGGSFAAPAYTSSKAALNMLTVVTALELKGTKVKVNAAHPGWVKTDMGGANAPLSVEEGAKTAVDLALLGADGPTGAFVHKGRPLPW